MPRISAESKVVLATGGTLLIAILMLAALAISDRQDIRAELRSEAARLDARMLGLESRMESRMLGLESRMDARLQALEDRFDSRFARLEERLDRVIELLGQDRLAADDLDRAPAPLPEDDPGAPLSSVTPVRGADWVIVASKPSPSAFWSAGSGN